MGCLGLSLGDQDLPLEIVRLGALVIGAGAVVDIVVHHQRGGVIAGGGISLRQLELQREIRQQARRLQRQQVFRQRARPDHPPPSAHPRAAR